MAILTTAWEIFYEICTNLGIQMKMIARFSTPYVKYLQINVISQQKIQNGTDQKNQLIIFVFVNTYPVYVVVITC